MKQTLEEAAKTFSNHLTVSDVVKDLTELAFKAGSDWQANQSPWISVKDRLPEPEEEILLYDRDSVKHYVLGWLRKKKGYNKAKWFVTNGYVADESITHWMPIPSFDEILKNNKSK